MIKTKGTIKPIPYITPAAIGTKSSKKFVTGDPWKYRERLPEAAIMKMRHVYIQKGPYRSGFSHDTSQNLGLKGINE